MRLQTERLILRDFTDDDWRVMHEHESNPEVVRYMSFDVCTEEQSRENIRRRRAYADEQPRKNWELAIASDDVVVGRCGIGITSFTLREGTIWFVLDPRHRRHGYITEAMRAVLSFGFGELQLHRIWGDCDPRNPASARVMQRLGMQQEAHLRENVFIKGEWCDSVVFAILDREWK